MFLANFSKNFLFSRRKFSIFSFLVFISIISNSKYLTRGSPDKFSYGSPKLGIFHVLSITFPNLLFVHNKLPYNNYLGDFPV